MKTNNGLKCFTCPPNRPQHKVEVRIIVIGMTGAGKSSIINFFYEWSKGIVRVQDI